MTHNVVFRLKNPDHGSYLDYISHEFDTHSGNRPKTAEESIFYSSMGSFIKHPMIYFNDYYRRIERLQRTINTRKSIVRAADITRKNIPSTKNTKQVRILQTVVDELLSLILEPCQIIVDEDILDQDTLKKIKEEFLQEVYKLKEKHFLQINLDEKFLTHHASMIIDTYFKWESCNYKNKNEKYSQLLLIEGHESDHVKQTLKEMCLDVRFFTDTALTFECVVTTNKVNKDLLHLSSDFIIHDIAISEIQDLRQQFRIRESNQ